LALVNFRQGRLREAQLTVDNLLAEDPDDLRALMTLGDIQVAREQFGAAAATFTHLLELTPDARIAVGLYVAKTRSGEPEIAVNHLEKWNAKHPAQPLVLRVLAEHHHRAGDTDTAASYYEELLRLKPEDAQIHNNLANLLMDVDNERAFKSAQRAYRLDPTNPAILDTMGWAYVQLGDLDRGLSHLRDAVARNGRSATIRYHLGIALEEFGNSAEARRQLSEALRLEPHAQWNQDAERRLLRLQR
jgi:tetratricopeptide (TPR) repeat protein